jgi:hypothetical protein
MGLHAGEATRAGGSLVGLDINRRPGSRRLRTAAAVVVSDTIEA